MGSLLIIWPGGADKTKLYKIDSRVPFTILPSTQPHFKWALSTPVMLICFSLSYDPAFNWYNPSVSSKG